MSSSVAKITVSAVLGATLLSTPALAVDLSAYSRAPIERTPIIESDEWGSNWYIRGNVGFVSSPEADLSRASIAFTQFTLDDSYSVGAGFGWKKDWFRIDITGDWFELATMTANGPTASGGNANVTADASAVAVLFNAYFDLGTWSGITPYVGAGIGTSYLTLTDYRLAGTAAATALADDPRWTFTWALMAGVAAEIMPGFTIDLGYRYINFGDVKTGVDALNVPILMKDWAAHEFRITARMMID